MKVAVLVVDTVDTSDIGWIETLTIISQSGDKESASINGKNYQLTT